MPGTAVKKGTFNNLDGGAGPDFALRLPGKGLKLKAGTYWVSVIADVNFIVSGQWYWNVNSMQHGNQAMWRNPGGFLVIVKHGVPLGTALVTARI